MNLTLRPATTDDAQLLFTLRNDRLTRQMSKSSDPVQWDGHIGWLRTRLARDHPDLYIAELAGDPVGTLRLDGTQVSYTVGPTFRNRGIATALLRLAVDQFGPLEAEIFEDNIPSIKAAESAGISIKLLPRSSLNSEPASGSRVKPH